MWPHVNFDHRWIFLPNSKLQYFLEYFPQVLLISVCANMWIYFESGNKKKGGKINIVSLPHSYVHCAPSSFSPNEWEICTWLCPNSALLCSWVIIGNDFNMFCCTLRCYLYTYRVECWATPTKIIAHMQCGAYSRWGVYFIQLEIISAGMIHGWKESKEIQYA